MLQCDTLFRYCFILFYFFNIFVNKLQTRSIGTQLRVFHKKKNHTYTRVCKYDCARSQNWFPIYYYIKAISRVRTNVPRFFGKHN